MGPSPPTPHPWLQGSLRRSIADFLTGLGLGSHAKGLIHLDGIQTVRDLQTRMAAGEGGPLAALGRLGLRGKASDRVLRALEMEDGLAVPAAGAAVAVATSHHPWYLGACGDAGAVAALRGE